MLHKKKKTSNFPSCLRQKSGAYSIGKYGYVEEGHNVLLASAGFDALQFSLIKKKKIGPPNTLQCGGRFNETLMEMSSCLLPYKWRKRREICWIFNEAESWVLWLHSYWWQGLIMNEVKYQFPSTNPAVLSQSREKQMEHHVLLWNNLWREGLELGTSMLGDCRTSSSRFYSLHRNYASLTCLLKISVMKLWIAKMEKWNSLY